MNMVIKKINCIIVLLLLLTCVFSLCTSNVSKAAYSDKIGAAVTEVNAENDDSNATEKVTSVLSVIITIVRIAGVCIAITMLLAVAMKYMTAAAGEKADIKKSAVQYVVGAVVLFGVVGILGIINEFSKNIGEG